MKYLIIFWLGVFVAVLACNNEHQTDLEIYTNDNIYYIKGLTVTNEVEAGEKRFETKEQLKEYISNLTANQWTQKIK